MTTRVPSGLNAADMTPTSCASIEFGEDGAESASQTRAVPSLDAVTTRVPSGLNAAEVT